MFSPADVAKIAATIYGTETAVLAMQGTVQQLSPEAFVPAAMRILKESYDAVAMGVDVYLDKHRAQLEAIPVGDVEPTNPAQLAGKAAPADDDGDDEPTT